MINNTINSLCIKLGETLITHNLTVCTAESCTGGGVSYAITAIPGSSSWFDRGFVTYTNEAKSSLLKVPKDIIDEHGAVSEVVAKLMAEGAISVSNANLSVAITGIAGPTGATHTKPLGTVWFAWSGGKNNTHSHSCLFKGSRDEIRTQAIGEAIRGLIAFANNKK